MTPPIVTQVRPYVLSTGAIRLEFGQQLSFLEMDRPSTLILVDILLRYLNGQLAPATQTQQPPAKILQLAIVPKGPEGA